MSPFDVFSGPMRSNDPRRFFIEAMIGAMRTDGDISSAENALLTRHIGQHALLSGLPAGAIGMMLEMAAQSIHFAGGSLARVSAIARGLCFRTHRLVAFALACEICALDAVVVDAEREFIEKLRVALRVSSLESEAIIDAILANKLQAFLLDRISRIWSLRPVISELFATRAYTKQQMNDHQRFAIRDFFCSITDLQGAVAELDNELYQCFRMPRGANNPVSTQLTSIAQLIPDPVDRYWLVVYSLAAEPPAQLAHWKLIPFAGLLQNVFQLVDQDMNLAVQDAISFPANLPRPA